MNAFYDAHLVLIQATLVGFVLALSIQVPLRMGVFSFAGAGSYGFGAYCCALLVIHTGMGALPAIAITVAATTVLGVLLGALIFRLNGLYLAMATVAFDLIIGVVALNGGTFTGASTGLYGVITDFAMPMMVTLTVIALALVAITEHGRPGRRIEAVRDDPQLAASVGINVRRYRLAAFAAGGALGGLSGAMNVLVRTTVGPLDIGFSLIVLALTMIVVGGARSWKGAAIGAVIFTWLPSVLTVLGQWQDLVYGVIVTTAAIFLPRGIHGVFVDVLRARRQRQHQKLERGDDPGAEEPAAPNHQPVESIRMARLEAQA